MGAGVWGVLALGGLTCEYLGATFASPRFRALAVAGEEECRRTVEGLKGAVASRALVTLDVQCVTAASHSEPGLRLWWSAQCAADAAALGTAANSSDIGCVRATAPPSNHLCHRHPELCLGMGYLVVATPRPEPFRGCQAWHVTAERCAAACTSGEGPCKARLGRGRATHCSAVGPAGTCIAESTACPRETCVPVAARLDRAAACAAGGCAGSCLAADGACSGCVGGEQPCPSAPPPRILAGAPGCPPALCAGGECWGRDAGGGVTCVAAGDDGACPLGTRPWSCSSERGTPAPPTAPSPECPAAADAAEDATDGDTAGALGAGVGIGLGVALLVVFTALAAILRWRDKAARDAPRSPGTVNNPIFVPPPPPTTTTPPAESAPPEADPSPRDAAPAPEGDGVAPAGGYDGILTRPAPEGAPEPPRSAVDEPCIYDDQVACEGVPEPIAEAPAAVEVEMRPRRGSTVSQLAGQFEGETSVYETYEEVVQEADELYEICGPAAEQEPPAPESRAPPLPRPRSMPPRQVAAASAPSRPPREEGAYENAAAAATAYENAAVLPPPAEVLYGNVGAGAVGAAEDDAVYDRMPTMREPPEYLAFWRDAGGGGGLETLLTGRTAAKFFRKSGLPNQALGRIWKMSKTLAKQVGGAPEPSHPPASMSAPEFFMALHLIAVCQQGVRIDRAAIGRGARAVPEMAAEQCDSPIRRVRQLDQGGALSDSVAI